VNISRLNDYRQVKYVTWSRLELNSESGLARKRLILKAEFVWLAVRDDFRHWIVSHVA
jgi:hypothetical protein